MIRLSHWLARPRVTLVLLLLPIVVFFGYFFALRYNIPWFDEFENIPYFLDRFLNARSAREALAALVRPNNEHRVVYARLVVLGQYWLTGGLNFANLMLWGNLGLVLIFYLLYRALRRHPPVGRQARLGMLPVPLLLFTAQNYLLTFTAIYTLQYLAIIMLVLLTLFVLATDRPLHVGLALGLGLLSTFSMGNGLLLWPAGAGMLLIQRRWRTLAIWLGVGAVGSYGYFVGYPVQQGNAEGFAYVAQHPLQTVAGFLIFAGSVFDLLPTMPLDQRSALPLLAGLGLVAGLGYWLVRTAFRRSANPSFFDAFVFGCLLFLLANIALIALFRIRFYFGIVLHSSYRTYALVLWSVAGVLLYSRLSETARLRYWPAVWLVFGGVNALTYVTYLPEALERRKLMQGLTFNQTYGGIGLGGTRDSELARYIARLTKLMRDRNWYHLPAPAITPDERRLTRPGPSRPDPSATAAVPLRVQQKPDYVVVSSDEPGYRVGLDRGTYLMMTEEPAPGSQTGRDTAGRLPLTYVMFANKNRPLGRVPWRVSPGFSAAMPTALIPAGRYRLGWFRQYPDHSEIQPSNTFVTVP